MEETNYLPTGVSLIGRLQLSLFEAICERGEVDSTVSQGRLVKVILIRLPFFLDFPINGGTEGSAIVICAGYGVVERFGDSVPVEFCTGLPNWLRRGGVGKGRGCHE